MKKMLKQGDDISPCIGPEKVIIAFNTNERDRASR